LATEYFLDAYLIIKVGKIDFLDAYLIINVGTFWPFSKWAKMAIGQKSGQKLIF